MRGFVFVVWCCLLLPPMNQVSFNSKLSLAHTQVLLWEPIFLWCLSVCVWSFKVCCRAATCCCCWEKLTPACSLLLLLSCEWAAAVGSLANFRRPRWFAIVVCLCWRRTTATCSQALISHRIASESGRNMAITLSALVMNFVTFLQKVSIVCARELQQEYRAAWKPKANWSAAAWKVDNEHLASCLRELNRSSCCCCLPAA